MSNSGLTQALRVVRGDQRREGSLSEVARRPSRLNPRVLFVGFLRRSFRRRGQETARVDRAVAGVRLRGCTARTIFGVVTVRCGRLIAREVRASSAAKCAVRPACRASADGADGLFRYFSERLDPLLCAPFGSRLFVLDAHLPQGRRQALQGVAQDIRGGRPGLRAPGGLVDHAAQFGQQLRRGARLLAPFCDQRSYGRRHRVPIQGRPGGRAPVAGVGTHEGAGVPSQGLLGRAETTPAGAVAATVLVSVDAG